jgi:hypothetical protein
MCKDKPTQTKENMMPELSVQEIMADVEKELAPLQRQLEQHLDFAQVERALTTLMATAIGKLLTDWLESLLGQADVVERLKALGAQCALRFKEYRLVHLRLSLGQVIEVRAPYWIKASPKNSRRRGKRGPNGSGRYLGLEVFGFIDRCSPGLLSDVVQQAVLSPSFEVARQVLAQRGLVLNIKTLRRLCQSLARRGLDERGVVSLADHEDLTGRTLVIGIDGGRMRERRRKRGRKPKDAKRQGYHREWREPKLFTLYALDDEGNVVKEFAPLYDATWEDHEVMFALLERYLKALDLESVSRVVFCGDGAPWIWNDVEALIGRLGLPLGKVFQVLDYTHAKQNVGELVALLPKHVRSGKLEAHWKHLLWQGKIEALRHEIEQTFTSLKRRQQALRKWRNYFETNSKRMQYEAFEAQGLPCGSGCVESAIRRVINLRLKAPGTFWTREMGEHMLFLRCQLLSGRWQIMLHNLTRRVANQLTYRQLSDVPANDYEQPQAA